MSSGPRAPVAYHQNNADSVIKGFLSASYRHQVAGSLRRADRTWEPTRENPMANDVDIVTTQPLDSVRKGLGRNKATGGAHVLTTTIAGSKINIIKAEPRSFGATLMYATGPKGSNIRNRMIAKQKGWKLNADGLWDANGRLLASSERSIYTALGKTWRPAERRGTPRR